MKITRHPSPNNQAGMTLIEIMIALLIGAFRKDIFITFVDD